MIIYNVEKIWDKEIIWRCVVLLNMAKPLNLCSKELKNGGFGKFGWRFRTGFLLLMTLLVLLFSSAFPAFAADNTVYKAEIDGEISDYMVNYLERAYADAESAGADAMLLELDTYGGYVTSAVSMKQVILGANIPTYCYINDKAISAGSLIALSCDKIVMKNGGTIGAAEPRLGSEKADEKVVSFWTAELSSAAETHGRDGRLAAAMSDTDVVIDGLSEEGRLLTLTSAQALEYGMADYTVSSDSEVMPVLGLDGASTVTVAYTFQEQATRFLNNSVVSTVLLAVGIGSLVLEVLFAGVGFFAALGVTALVIYFIGALLVSYTAWIAIALAFAGLVLLTLEIFVIPGFGICGILGILSIIGAVISVAPSFAVAMLQIVVALIVAVLLVVISLKCGKTRRVWSRLILKTSTSTSDGYVSASPAINTLLGKRGVALTDLRPSGAALIDGKRTDVLTEGSFIKRGTAVRVIRIEGSGVVVSEDEDNEG
jgi:membrane-bound serine protease (ClpP class)